LNDSKRILIAALASVLILFAWNELVMPKQRRAAPAKPPAAQAPAAVVSPSGTAAPPAPAARPVETPPPSAPEELVVLETPEFRATFTSFGGALRQLVLKEETYRRRGGGEKPDAPVDLVQVRPGEPWPLSVVPSAELGGSGDAGSDPAARTPMRVASRDARTVAFEGRQGGVEVRKVFRVGERPYQIDVELAVGGGERPGSVSVLYPAFMAPDAPKPGFFSGGEVYESVTPICRAGDKTARFDGKEALKVLSGPARFVGLDQHYFVSVMMPEGTDGECVFARLSAAGETAAALRLPVAQPLRTKLTVYAGPKQLDLLRAYAGRDLDTAIDYGPVTNFFAFFARILLWVMQRFYGFVHNWGVAIILLTLVVKALLYPLTVKSMQSMQEMRKLQPEVEKLKKKLGDDKEKMNQAVMQLYQQHKVNPLGGCLPLLLQMPIWLALYATLQTSVELYRQPFLWIRDLTTYDPYYVLPLAMGASSFAMQKLSPQPADNAQAKMLLYFMPVFFTFIMLKLPAGLTLYILVNNLLTIAQQQWLMRKEPKPAKA